MSIKKSISYIFSAQILNTVIGFITSIIITRILGAEGRGENAIFTNATAFAVLFFGFSISSTIPYFINSGKAKADELLTSIIVFSILSAALVFATLCILENAGKLHWVLSSEVQSFQYKLIFTGVYVSNLMSGVLSTYLLTFKKFKQVSILGIVFQLLPLGIYLLLYFDIIPYNHEQPFVYIVNVIATVSFLSIIGIIFLFKKTIPVRPSKKLIPATLIKQFILFSSMAYIGNVATFFNYKLDFWVVDEYYGKSQLGIYSLAAQLSQLLWILPSAIASVLYSYASHVTEQKAVQYTIRLKQLAFYATLFLGLIGLGLAYFLIPILYGNEFISAYYLMPIFLAGVIPFSIPTVVASLFAARGNFKISFIVSLVVFIISGVLYFTLIPRYGIKGGAVASATAYFISTIMCEIWFCREYKISYLNLFKLDTNGINSNFFLKLFNK